MNSWTLATFCTIGSTIKIATVILAISQFSPVLTAQNKNCTVPLGPHPNRYFPLIASKTRGILQPVGNRSILIQKRETVRIACPGINTRIVGQNVAILNATCDQTGRLVSPYTSNFTINCTKSIEESINQTNISCGSNPSSKKIYIGWRLPDGEIFRQIEVCFNYLNLTTEYTHHVIRGDAIAYRDRDVSWQGRASFKQDKFFSAMSPSITSSYTKEKQRETLTQLLGSRERADFYVGGWGPSSFLAKGHLSPDADFALQSWQDATYHFINVAPQWQEFNNGNWKILENAIRIMAARPYPRNLTIHTGTYGVSKLQDINGHDVPFYLAQGNKRQVPVPKYVWKIVSDSSRNESVAFVSVNIPGTSPSPPEAPVCNSICFKIEWVTWPDRESTRKGVMYCCKVSELRNRFRNVPHDVPGEKLLER